MGSKSSSAPPPDPRLVEAQLRSMDQQNSMLDRIVSNSEAMLPMQREQTQFALDVGRQAVKDAQADRSWMLTRRAMLSGVQDRLAKDAETFDEKVRTDELAQQAQADAQAAISNARASSARDLARRGIMPGTGRANDARLVLGEAALTAGAANTARRAARQEGYALTDRAVNALAGYPAMSSAVSSQGATLASGGVGTVNAGATGMNAGFGTAADVAGRVGANATGMYGAQASFKNAQDQIAASSDPFNTILGAAAGVGTSWAMGNFLPKPSDPRLKENVTLVGKDEATGLNLYEFTYKGGDGRRWRGVMADEVQRVCPAAVVYDDLGFASVNYGLLGLKMVEV